MYIVLDKVILIVGIILCSAGAWYISRGLVKKTEDVMCIEVAFVYSWNDNYVLSSIKQKVEGTAGCILIGLGSIFQVISIMIYKNIFILEDYSLLFGVVMVTLAILILIVCVYKLANRGIDRYYMKRVISYIKEYRCLKNETNISDIKRYIKYVKDVKPKTDDKRQVIVEFDKTFGTNYSEKLYQG